MPNMVEEDGVHSESEKIATMAASTPVSPSIKSDQSDQLDQLDQHQPVIEHEKEKSEDKLEIEGEERAQLFNNDDMMTMTVAKATATPVVDEETEVTTNLGSEINKGSEVEKKKRALEEAEKECVKKRIPIGGIKIPGFRFARSRDTKNKDYDTEEGRDLLQLNSEASTPHIKGERQGSKLSQFSRNYFKFTNPFASKKKNELLKGENEKLEEKKDDCPSTSLRNPAERILDAIKAPLASVIPCNLKLTKKKDLEAGGDEVGLAPVETLEMNSSKVDDDGMENVKLDCEDKTENTKVEKDLNQGNFWNRVPDWKFISITMREHKLVTGGVGVFLILLLIIITMAAAGPKFPTEAPIIDGKYVAAVTYCGYVEGLLEHGAVVFRGIPYAQPPVGDLRWKPPKKFDLGTCWNNTLKAHNSTPPCWQTYSNLTSAGSENCLTLDIITPSVQYYNPLPVIVHIGSETFNGGSPGVMVVPPKLSAKRDVLFVRVNFRLGVLGFLASETIKKTIHPPTSGNYGLMDIVHALEWIHMNIVHFGGDPNSVIVLGHRAGGTLVTALTAFNWKKPLFTKAWISNAASIFPGRSLEEAEVESYNEYLKNLNCPAESATCLRSLTVEALTNALPKTWRRASLGLPKPNENITEQHEWLVQDGVVVQSHPSEVWMSGNVSIKVVIGTTMSADLSDNLRARFENATSEEIARYVKDSRIGQLGYADEALRRYGATWPGLLAMISDIRTVCPALTYVVRKFPGSTFYVVNKTYTSPADADADVMAILGLYETHTPETRRFVATMQQLFQQFVNFGTIHSSSSRTSQMLFIDQDAQPTSEHQNCDFWIQKDFVPRYGRIN